MCVCDGIYYFVLEMLKIIAICIICKHYLFSATFFHYPIQTSLTKSFFYYYINDGNDYLKINLINFYFLIRRLKILYLIEKGEYNFVTAKNARKRDYSQKTDLRICLHNTTTILTIILVLPIQTVQGHLLVDLCVV